MDWMSNLFIVLLMTTVTGSAFYAVGEAFQKLWFKHDARLLRFQMIVTQGAYVVPFVYAVLYMQMRRDSQTSGSGNNNLFYSTPAMRGVSAALGCLWLVLFMALFMHKLYVRLKWMQIFRGNIPEEDAGTEAVFEEICERMGISGKVSLYRNDLVEMPCITYVKGFAVVLPLKRYTKKETSVILYHELCHYLSGDIYLKTACCIVSLLHAFNPAVYLMLRRLSLVCEECCDRMACERGEGIFSRKEYFRTILSALAEEGNVRERYNLFLLADTIGDYERRVRSMREYRVHGKFKRGTAVLLAAGFLLGSSITAVAAGEGMTVAYGKAAEATSERTEELTDAVDIEGAAVSMSDEELLEEFARAYDLDPADVVIVGEEGIEVIGNFINVDWKIPAGKTFMTTNFHKDAGSEVTVTTVGKPSGTRYQTGIKDPKDLMRYIEGSGNMAHTFDVEITGGHCFFVTNLGSGELNIQGSVIK